MANKLTASADAHSGRQLCWPVPARRAQGSAQAKPRLGRTLRVYLEGGRFAAAPWHYRSLRNSLKGWPDPHSDDEGGSVAVGRVGLTGGFRGASIGASIYGSYRGAAPLSMAPLEEPLLYLWPL